MPPERWGGFACRDCGRPVYILRLHPMPRRVDRYGVRLCQCPASAEGIRKGEIPRAGEIVQSTPHGLYALAGEVA